jgi:hypothetical protein
MVPRIDNYFKRLQDGQSSKTKVIVSVNLSCAMFCILVILTLEVGTYRLCLNVCKELPLYTAQCPRREQITHVDFVMLALVWLRVVWFIYEVVD